MDLINDLAYPLPVSVIAELLGVPLEDRDTFRVWGDKWVEGATHSQFSPETDDFVDLQSEMDDYFNTIIDKRTKSTVRSHKQFNQSRS